MRRSKNAGGAARTRSSSSCLSGVSTCLCVLKAATQARRRGSQPHAVAIDVIADRLQICKIDCAVERRFSTLRYGRKNLMRSHMLKFTAALALVLGLTHHAQAQSPFGDFHGDWHDVAVASCNPHCGTLGGNDPQGDDHDFTDTFPDNVVLNGAPGKGRVECSNTPGSNGCVFETNQSVEVDNAAHKVYTHIRSRSTAVRVRPVVEIYQMNSAKQ